MSTKHIVMSTSLWWRGKAICKYCAVYEGNGENFCRQNILQLVIFLSEPSKQWQVYFIYMGKKCLYYKYKGKWIYLCVNLLVIIAELFFLYFYIFLFQYSFFCFIFAVTFVHFFTCSKQHREIFWWHTIQNYEWLEIFIVMTEL